MKIVSSAFVLGLCLSGISNLKAGELDDLKKRVDDLELNAMSSSFKFSGQIENRYDWNEKKNESGNTLSVDKNSYFSSYGRLNFTTKPTDDVSVFGRLSMAKFWNDVYYNGTRPDTTLGTTVSSGRSRSTAALYVERLFANWNLSDDLVLTVGRLPTIDGGPKHLAIGSSVMGSYPLAAYAAIFDGLALTKIFTGADWSLKARLIYTPFQTPNFNGQTSDLTNSKNQKMPDKADTLVANFDYSKDNVAFSRNLNSIFQVMLLENLSYVYNASSTDNATDGNAKASYLTLTFHNELTNVANTELDLYLTLKYSKIKTSGCYIGSNPSACTLGGYYTSGASVEREGHIAWIGLRKTIAQKNFIGAEYIYNSKYSGTTDSASQDLANLYGTTGSRSLHAYITRQFNQSVTMTIGFSQQKQFYTFTSGVFGNGAGASISNSSLYSRFIVNF